MSFQLIFLVALVAGCFANSIVKANEASVYVPNLWKLEVDVKNITSTAELASKDVITSEGQLYLEVEYGTLNPISCEPIGNNGVMDRYVTTDFDIVLRVPLYPQFDLVREEEDRTIGQNLIRVKSDEYRRMDNDIILPYSPRHLHPSELPLWEMDFNKEWTYEFDGTIYRLIFSIRKV